MGMDQLRSETKPIAFAAPGEGGPPFYRKAGRNGDDFARRKKRRQGAGGRTRCQAHDRRRRGCTRTLIV
jgi:hypothetical protein